MLNDLEGFFFFLKYSNSPFSKYKYLRLEFFTPKDSQSKSNNKKN